MQIISGTSGGSGASGPTIRAATTAISNASATVTATFSQAFPNTNYALIVSITNVTDATPIFLQVVDTTKSTTGFVATLNAPADTANYSLEYVAVGDN